MNPLPVPPLLVVTDGQQARRPLEDVAAAAFAGGCRWLSVREKSLQAEKRLTLVDRIRAIAAAFGATVTVHDDMTAAARCAGIHLPAHGDPAAARRLLGARALVGKSAHSVEEAIEAERAGADYVTLSPIFLTASKPGYGPALGTAAISEAAARLRIPVVALGGIAAPAIPQCVAAGADGVAVMGEIMRADDAAAATATLLRRFS